MLVTSMYIVLYVLKDIEVLGVSAGETVYLDINDDDHEDAVAVVQRTLTNFELSQLLSHRQIQVYDHDLSSSAVGPLLRRIYRRVCSVRLA